MDLSDLRPPLDQTKMVISVSSQILDPAAVTALMKRLNFAAPTLTVVPIKTLSVGLKRQPGDFQRHKPVSFRMKLAVFSYDLAHPLVIWQWKCRTLQSLMADSTLCVIAADKGNARVIIDKCNVHHENGRNFEWFHILYIVQGSSI